MTGVLRDAHDADIAQLATKTDLARLEAALKSDMARLEAALKSDMARLEDALKSDMARIEDATRSDFTRLEAQLSQHASKGEVAALRADMEILRCDLTIRLGSMIVVATGILLAAKFFG